jgi:hypothetical protein
MEVGYISISDSSSSGISGVVFVRRHGDMLVFQLLQILGCRTNNANKEKIPNQNVTETKKKIRAKKERRTDRFTCSAPFIFPWFRHASRRCMQKRKLTALLETPCCLVSSYS